MNEIREKYPPREVDNQVEFDRIMSELNQEQSTLNHPYLDRDRELAKQRDLLEQQKQAINIQLKSISIERYDLEQKRKDINRVFHEIKHEFIMMNPREKYINVKQEA